MTLICAPGTVAPDESFTMPEIVLDPLWATRAVGAITAIARAIATTTERDDIIELLLEERIRPRLGPQRGCRAGDPAGRRAVNTKSAYKDIDVAGRRPVEEKQEGLTKNPLRLARASPARYTRIDNTGTSASRQGDRKRSEPDRSSL